MMGHKDGKRFRTVSHLKRARGVTKPVPDIDTSYPLYGCAVWLARSAMQQIAAA